MQKEYNRCHLATPCINCSLNLFCRSWVDFVNRHNDTKSYAHFDRRVSLSMTSIRNYVMDECKIAKHSFYPFIHFEKKSCRYGKKATKKTRHLYYCSHLDRCVYQRYAFLINYQYNIWADKNNIDKVAIAYRNNKGNNVDFAKCAFDSIRNFQKCFIIVGDFTNFFDNIKHDYLKYKLCEVLDKKRLPQDYFSVFKNITRFSSWDWDDIVKAAGENISERGIRKKINNKEQILTKEQFDKNKKYITKNISGIGIPQGSPISAVLSNVYMVEIDIEINSYVTSKNGFYMRYSDDFIIILPYENYDDITTYKNYIFQFFASKEDIINLQKEKTSSYIYQRKKIYKNGVETNIDYLGFLFDGQKIKLRPRSITKYYYRMRRKARTIGRRNWTSPYGRHISAKNIYTTYSSCRGKRQTFIDYAKNAKAKLNLDDQEVDSLITNHKQKISNAIKEFNSKS